MRFTIVSPDGAEYGCENLETYREKYKPAGYLIARDQPSYQDWGIPEDANADELPPDPDKPITRRAKKRGAGDTPDGATEHQPQNAET